MKPAFKIRRITEVEGLPDGMESDVEIIRLESSAQARRLRRGRKYGDLVHALLAQAEYPANRAGIEALATVHEIGSKMTAGEREAAIEVAVRTFSHPLVTAAFASERVHREFPVTYETNGELYEGVIDLTWFDGMRWNVLDYKTGPGDEPRYRRQVTIYGEALRKVTGAPARLVVLEIA